MPTAAPGSTDPIGPSTYSTDGTVNTGKPEKLSFAGGYLLGLSSGGDTTKVIVASTAADTCAGDAAPGSLVSDLGTPDSSDSSLAEVEFTFTLPGSYWVCYQVAGGVYGGQWKQVGAALIVSAAIPTNATGSKANGQATTDVDHVVTFTGGSGLDLGSAKNAAKAVSGSGSCSDGPADGTTIITDLGPTNAIGAVSATGSFSWSTPGTYKMCYSLEGQVWVAVGDLVVAQSSNATLQSLNVSQPISPTFRSTKTGYTVTVPYDVGDLTFSAATTHAKGTLQGGLQGALTTLPSATSRTVALTSGKVNKVEIAVSAEDQNQKTYTIYATRNLAVCTAIAQWAEWGNCAGSCDTGTRTRTRTVTPPSCQEQTVMSEDCILEKKCGEEQASVEAATEMTGISKEQMESPAIANVRSTPDPPLIHP